jgi:N6-L-threonylcarbamoyladenine synthase
MPSLSLCGDNAAMIASRGYYQYLKQDFASFTLDAVPTLKLRGERPSKSKE